LVDLIPNSQVTIGRGQACTIQIEDASISRQHAVLHVSDVVMVEDVGSANGTTLVRSRTAASDEITTGGSVPLRPGEQAQVRVGDVLRLGTVVLVLQAKGRGASGSGSFAAVEDAGPILVDDEMKKTHALVKRAATTDMSILILGETGVGKEVMAEAVHRHSHRANGPFLKLNCAAISETLLESELFGHERGAFTGAHNARAGLLESTDGGTVFLDEVGELPLGTQAKLLRVLEERTVLRVGSAKPRAIDVRFVTATNRDLNRRAKEGLFRRDLYYRISGLVVKIPALRDRRSEIEPLALHFLRELGARNRQRHAQLTPAALERLLSHTWPGNVRELRNVMERAALLASGDAVDAPHILLEHVESMMPPPPNERRAVSERPSRPSQVPQKAPLLEEFSKEYERARIIRALEQCGGNQTRAAELLGISRRTLINRMEDFNLPRPKKR
jgi:transcriptional regulator with PAS, ATPase and Fis domain